MMLPDQRAKALAQELVDDTGGVEMEPQLDAANQVVGGRTEMRFHQLLRWDLVP